MSTFGFTGAPALDILRRPYASGGYFHFDGPRKLSAGSAAAIGQLRLTPGFLHAPVTISEFGCGVTALSAAGNFQALLYAAHPVTNLPVGAPLIQTGNLSTAATGQIKQAGLATALPPGLYWSGVQADNAGAAFTAHAIDGPFVSQVVGVLSGGTFGIGGGSNNITGLGRGGVFNAPPVLAGAWATDSWSVDVSLIAASCFFRAA